MMEKELYIKGNSQLVDAVGELLRYRVGKDISIIDAAPQLRELGCLHRCKKGECEVNFA